MKLLRSISIVLFIAASGALSAEPVIIPFADLDVATWHRKGTQPTNGSGTGGALNVIDPDKTATAPTIPLTKVDPADPATWTVPQRNWTGDWQGQHPYTQLVDNAWIIIDLGAEVIPAKMYIWNVSEATGWTRGIYDFNLYYATAPTVPVNWWAKSSALPTTATEYDFQSGGWTQFGSTNNVARGGLINNAPVSLIIDFNRAIPAARYLGIEIISNWDYGPDGVFNNTGNIQAGINCAVITKWPPPSGLVIMIK